MIILNKLIGDASRIYLYNSKIVINLNTKIKTDDISNISTCIHARNAMSCRAVPCYAMIRSFIPGLTILPGTHWLNILYEDEW